ncbi:MAG: hypothetical protein IT429_06215 [Gemmataceae bacterium]|nr:hypothetical protein [Gemmataceae bacterium]
MVCGHTPRKNGRPRHLGHAVCLATWVYGDGWLKRTGWIEELVSDT